jgi:hypothetical protein
MPKVLFISAPASPSKQSTYQSVKSILSDFAITSPIDLPEFKVYPLFLTTSQVGTLDSLYILSDELIKHDGIVEALTWRISDFYKSLGGTGLVVGDGK